MNDTIDYEFGVDRPKHIHAGETILRASLISVAFFWNQLAVLYSEKDMDFLNDPALAQLRSGEADALDAMARSVLHKADFLILHPESLIDPSLLAHPRYNEYVRNSIARFDELQNIVGQLQTQP
jgi:multidrug resistance protein MdtO